LTGSTFQILERGQIREIKKSIAKVTGLYHGMNGQLLEISNDIKGMIMGFTREEALVLLLGKTEEAKIGQTVYNRRETFRIPVGDAFIGRVVTALAESCDGKGPVIDGKDPTATTYPIFREAPGVLDRIPITEVFETGALMIDASVPIGKGQRELIIGDRMTGKTTLCVDTILHQKGKGVICIYCCIGRSFASLKKIAGIFQDAAAMDYTIIVSATASASAGEQYLAPYTACAIGEYFMDRGKHVFIVYDDLTKNAWAYRQLSLLLERSPGRDAYPGDIFYIHSQLMERAGKYKPERGAGSMTFFPIVDALQGDITGYVPSNLVSMTDGQIYLSSALFNSGVKPAVDLGLSVSRIGNKVQSPAMKELSGMLRLQYLQYTELLKLTRFKASLSDETRQQLAFGDRIARLFIQDKNRPRPLAEELFFLYALSRGVLKNLTLDQVDHFKEQVLAYGKREFKEVVEELSLGKKLTPEFREKLDGCLNSFCEKAFPKKLEEAHASP